MIKLKDILQEALPDVPMTIGFRQHENYEDQIVEQFLRFYQNDDGNKTGRFIEMASQLVDTYGSEAVQQNLERIDDLSNKINELIKPISKGSGHNIKSPLDKSANATIWKYLDDAHETVNEIINNSTFNGWPIDTVITELDGLYSTLDELKMIYTSNFGPKQPNQNIGFR
tara:strand:- start:1099 stop:1608 length:510 start_codon:yes stop_codon:yes gene_type:complete